MYATFTKIALGPELYCNRQVGEVNRTDELASQKDTQAAFHTNSHAIISPLAIIPRWACSSQCGEYKARDDLFISFPVSSAPYAILIRPHHIHSVLSSHVLNDKDNMIYRRLNESTSLRNFINMITKTFAFYRKLIIIINKYLFALYGSCAVCVLHISLPLLVIKHTTDII